MLGLVFAGNMLLATAHPPECRAELCWSVSPAFCVSATVEQNCEAMLTVSWNSSNAENICLYFAQQQMQCWQQAKQGQWQQSLSWPGKTEVRLTIAAKKDAVWWPPGVCFNAKNLIG